MPHQRYVRVPHRPDRPSSATNRRYYGLVRIPRLRPWIATIRRHFGFGTIRTILRSTATIRRHFGCGVIPTIRRWADRRCCAEVDRFQA